MKWDVQNPDGETIGHIDTAEGLTAKVIAVGAMRGRDGELPESASLIVGPIPGEKAIDLHGKTIIVLEVKDGPT